MKSTNRVFLAIATLALVALSCQAVSNLGGGGGETPVVSTSAPLNPVDTTDIPGSTEAPTTDAPVDTQPTGDVILEDDFSSAQWGTGTDTDSSVEYVNDALQIIVYTKNYFVWSTPDDQDYENVHMEVTVTNNNTDPTTAFGFMCNQQTVSDSFYYFAVTAAGQYAIAKAAVGQPTDLFLTNDDKWEYSDAITPNSSSYRLGADCGNGTLTLYVDGQQVDSISDSTYTNGGVALFVWSGEESTTTNVTFDDFLMTELGQ